MSELSFVFFGLLTLHSQQRKMFFLFQIFIGATVVMGYLNTHTHTYNPAFRVLNTVTICLVMSGLRDCVVNLLWLNEEAFGNLAMCV